MMIKVIGKENCGACMMAKKVLTRKGVEFEYACIQNKSLEIDGEYGESDYDVFMHIVDDDTVYLLFADDINNSTALSRKLTKYKRLMTPKDFE